jgi:hypothetical protein
VRQAAWTGDIEGGQTVHGPHGYLTKTAAPAVTAEQLGPVDLVLVSHDNHPATWMTAAAPWLWPPRCC